MQTKYHRGKNESPGVLENTKRIFILILERLLGILLMVMVAVTFAEVSCRYVLGFSLIWSHEIVVLILIWSVWLSVPIGFDRIEHLSVTFFVEHNSRIGKFQFAWLHGFLAIIFLVLVFFLSLPVIDAYQGMNLLSIPLPISSRYYAAPVGCFFSVFVLLVNMVQNIKE